jgi:hypothetical protein
MSDDIDLDFRPQSYWSPAGPLSAIVQNIKGQNRRQMARDLIAGGMDQQLGEIEADLLDDTLTPEQVAGMGRLHPSFMGGEYLPDYSTGEVEIARVVLQSSTQDVFSLRARRVGKKRPVIRYRFVDEYEETFTLQRDRSSRPLTMGEVIALIDSVEATEMELSDEGFVETWVLQQLEQDDTVDDALAFVSVESELYPQLQAYYEARLREFAEEWVADNREEDDEE